MNPDTDRIARLQLMSVIEGGSGFWTKEIEKHNSAEVLARIKAGDYLMHSPSATRRSLSTNPEQVTDLITRAGVRVVIPGDSEWPTQLNDLEAPPLGLCLSGEGDLRSIALCSLAIVGARAASDYGARLASEMALQLGERGWNVISGAAYGIDAAAHRGSLASGAQTVAVLASGVDQLYPAGHEKLFAAIRANGVLVSEVLPGVTPTRGRFLVRNRIIAALTRGTLVVEAALRSGSLRTAADALTMNRPVMAMPGPVSSPTSAGCHRLVMDRKAELVTDLEDVLIHIGPLLISNSNGSGLASAKFISARDDLVDGEQDLLEMFPSRVPISVEKLANLCDLTPNRILALLGLLATKGFIERNGAGWILTKKGKAA
ncbi:MAG TPA: DNA-processing protein DprA [Candidatus Nanopelagicaceae bacterium]|nr:DNA-processing protein DprA [Candidatus Nanopelagicaceae bacterium]